MVSTSGSYNIWYRWISSSSSTSTDTWTQWNSTYDTGTSTATSSDSTWTNWNTISYRSNYERDYREETPVPNRASNRAPNTVEAYQKLKKQREEAEEKALNLLLDLIGEEQLKTYKKTGRLFVKGNKYDYIVQKSGFIKRVEKDKITDLCVHLDNRNKFPATDNVIAMKLALEIDEDLILKKANNHGSCERPKQLPKAACM